MKTVYKPFLFILFSSLLLLVWVQQGIPLTAIWETLSALTPLKILALGLINIAIVFLFCSRWWLILKAQGYSIPYFSLVRYRLAAFAISYFTPGSQFGGEPLQVFALQQRHHVPGPFALAAVSLDKLFEILANFTFLAIGMILILKGGLFSGLASVQAMIAIAMLLIIPLIYLATLATGHFPLTSLVVRLPNLARKYRLVDRVGALVAATERQVATLFRNKPLIILWILLLSGIIWGFMLFEYWLMLRFLGPGLNLRQTISALTAVRLAFLMPVPGGLGALEASQVFAMRALGFLPALGVSLSLLIRARDLSFGLIGLWVASTFFRTGYAHHRPVVLPDPAPKYSFGPPDPL